MAVKIYGSNQIDFDANNIIQNTQLNNTVLNDSLTALDTTTSNGATSNADNTALPLFGCRAFVNFDGTSVQTIGTEEHCAIRSSGNVSKVVKKGTGDFEIHFETAMPDKNYVIAGSISNTNNNWASERNGFNRGTHGIHQAGATEPTANMVRIESRDGARAESDGSEGNFNQVCVVIFR